MSKKKPTLKELRLKEERRQHRLEINRKIRERRKQLYYSVDLEARQNFIAFMHEGKTIGDASKAAGINDFDVALAIVAKNLKVKTIKVERLNKPEDVK